MQNYGGNMAETLYGVECREQAGSLKLTAAFTTPVDVRLFQPPRSTGKLQTQAVSPQYRDASMTRRSSGAGDTLGDG